MQNPVDTRETDSSGSTNDLIYCLLGLHTFDSLTKICSLGSRDITLITNDDAVKV